MTTLPVLLPTYNMACRVQQLDTNVIPEQLARQEAVR